MFDAARFYEEAKYWAPVISLCVGLYKGIEFFKNMSGTLVSIRNNDLHHMHLAVSELNKNMDNHTNTVREHLEKQTEVLEEGLEKQTNAVVGELKELRADIRNIR